MLYKCFVFAGNYLLKLTLSRCVRNSLEHWGAVCFHNHDDAVNVRPALHKLKFYKCYTNVLCLLGFWEPRMIEEEFSNQRISD